MTHFCPYLPDTPLWAGLAQQSDQPVLDSLILWLQTNSDESVRRSAADALGKIGDKKGVEPLNG